MTDTARAQLRRLLELIPTLADGNEHSIAAVARRAGTSRKTLVRDLSILTTREGEPGGFVESVECYLDAEKVALRSAHFLRPMRVTLAELAAIELGLAMLEKERPREEQAAIARVRGQLQQVIASLPAETFGPAPHAGALGAEVDLELLATLRRAARARRKLRVRYQGSGARRPGERTACPYGLVFAERMWYLVAHCERGEGLRFFRVDRILEATRLEASFEVPEDFSLDALVRDGRAFSGEAPERLRVWYSPRVARWVSEREGRAPAPDGSIEVEYPLADPEWAIRHVLQYGPDARVLHPASLHRELVVRLRAMAE